MDRTVNSVGLAGDGDEIAAISDVEREFGITFDPDDASRWFTAGDLFECLRAKLPGSSLSDREMWERFAFALSHETGVDPRSLSRESPLILDGHPWRKVHDFLGRMWLVLLVIAGLAIGAAILD